MARDGGSRLRRLSATAAWVVLFGASARWAGRQSVSDEESSVFRAINDLPGAAHRPVWAVMQAGSFPAVGVTAIAARAGGRPRLALRLGVAGTISWIACKVVKQFVRRGRPDAELSGVSVRGRAQSGLGFPSGHSAVAFSLASSLGDEVSPSVRRVAWLAASIVAFARMYVGAHLPADVVGGTSLGIAIGSLVREAVPSEG